MSRGVLSIIWGDETKLPLARLAASLKKHHPELPHEIVRFEASSENFDGFNLKASMLELSPFDETLFLDADTVVMSRLDFGFDKARAHGLAVSICECPWGRRYQKIFEADEVEYNTGVIFFTREARPLFDRWKALAAEVDSSIVFIPPEGGVAVMPAADQGSFALAVEQTGFNPFVLPLNWNFRPKWHKSFFGPIRVWHDYSEPPAVFDELNRYYESDDAIIQYHAIGGK